MTSRPLDRGGPDPSARLRVIVAVKAFHRAKSRFTGLDPELRESLVWSMLVDSLSAVADHAAEIVIVSGEPGLRARLDAVGIVATVVPDPGDLNAAIRSGERSGRPPGSDGNGGPPTLAMTADLPALRSAEIAGILATAGTSPRCFVADHTGAGTTMLLSRTRLDPRFGGSSAQRHQRSGAIALPGPWPGARLDVDDRAGLQQALALGVGAYTARLLDRDPTVLRPPA